jgi:hypothetical protein
MSYKYPYIDRNNIISDSQMRKIYGSKVENVFIPTKTTEKAKVVYLVDSSFDFEMTTVELIDALHRIHYQYPYDTEFTFERTYDYESSHRFNSIFDGYKLIATMEETDEQYNERQILHAKHKEKVMAENRKKKDEQEAKEKRDFERLSKKFNKCKE